MGIDEAGRGPVLGPMVMAAVCLDSQGARRLTRAGLRDSKAFGASEKGREIRAEFAALVNEVALHVDVWVVDVVEIDRRVCRGELNVLEREVARTLIDRAPAVDRIIADGTTLFRPLAASYPHMTACNHAESRHAAVAAASVAAKHRRDEIFERIRQRYLPIFGEVRGGGYGNQATQDFLRAYARRFRRLPPEARRSWPYPYLYDILGDDFDPLSELDPSDAQRTQLGLFGTR